MKRLIVYSLFAAAVALSAAACMKIDNFDAPDCHISGRIIDATTGENILTDQGHCNIRIWERSFNNASPQDLKIKQDGTYNNTKLFAGTYDMHPEGAWWPADTLKGVGIGKRKVQDFEVTPYLKLVDFKAEFLDKDKPLDLTLSCRMAAPKEDGLPLIMDLRPFLSLNQFCGAQENLGQYNVNQNRVSAVTNKMWADLAKEADGMTVRYFVTVEVKAGYTYFVRMGARVQDSFQKYNYTEIIEVNVSD